MARKQSKGTCSYCGAVFTKRGMTSHLEKCARRLQAIEAAERTDAKSDVLVHLRAYDAYVKFYWLDLEVNGSAPLEEVDAYLRAIWLECCGHLSQFVRNARDWENEIAMKRPVAAVFRPGTVILHRYDFGSTTETGIECLGVREGKPTTRHPIALMARNEQPEAACSIYGKPATELCSRCSWEGEPGDGQFCDRHADEHADEGDDHWVSPIVNSPRLGICGYEGPATAPY